MELQDIFKRLGYPKNTDTVYRTLSISKEPLLVSTIAQHANVSRMVVYRCLLKLEESKLVSRSVIGRRTFYALLNPRRLKQLIAMCEKESGEVIEKYAKEREKEVPQSIRFMYGASGIRSAFDDVLAHTKKGDTFFRYTSERDLARVNRYLARDYRIRRDKKKLERLVISNPVSGKQKKSRLERFIKFIPREVDLFEQDIIQLIYGNRVTIINLNTEEVFVIENKQLADFQKTIFNLLYKKL
ncbi:MAG: hypothetical protein UV60_C0006G0042 [Parcubacteria group bacterium GW2011_GWA2_43_11]|nr:MAG: hypothetical protein UU89_C0005G0003 [Parcubacteria group bacterium GW2011_GWC2_42_11]KKS85690.1 MAG: hypothetical protein UV60_C0006G0042 [Parcubacteria group bacterium GW2011_GWA2_43_11]